MGCVGFSSLFLYGVHKSEEPARMTSKWGDNIHFLCMQAWTFSVFKGNYVNAGSGRGIKSSDSPGI